MAYQIFERTSVRVGELSLSLGASGSIALNAAASRTLKHAGVKAVLLLWDKSLRKVAVKAASKADKNAYAVSFSGSHSGTVRAKAFLDFIGWGSNRQMFPATWNEKEKMLEITLPAQNAEHKKSPGPDHKGAG